MTRDRNLTYYRCANQSSRRHWTPLASSLSHTHTHTHKHTASRLQPPTHSLSPSATLWSTVGYTKVLFVTHRYIYLLELGGKQKIIWISNQYRKQNRFLLPSPGPSHLILIILYRQHLHPPLKYHHNPRLESSCVRGVRHQKKTRFHPSPTPSVTGENFSTPSVLSLQSVIFKGGNTKTKNQTRNTLAVRKRQEEANK